MEINRELAHVQDDLAKVNAKWEAASHQMAETE
jgi:hypothetical protein